MQKKQITDRLMQICLIFVAGILAGCIFFHFLWRGSSAYQQAVWLADLDTSLECTADTGMLHRMVFGGMVLFLVLLLSGFAKIGKIFAQGLSFCTGVVLGWIFSLIIVGRGGMKMLSFLLNNAFLFLISFPFFFFAIILTCNMSTEWKIPLKQHKTTTRNYILFMISCLLGLVCGVLLWCYVNPKIWDILQKF